MIWSDLLERSFGDRTEDTLGKEKATGMRLGKYSK